MAELIVIDDELDPQLFRDFCRVVYEKTGICLKEGKEALVASRIGKRLRSLQIPTFKEYFKFIQSEQGRDECIQLINVITTNVTHFFREQGPISFLQKQLDCWKTTGQNRFRVWSAACSSGEEPYTLAMVMAETLGFDGTDWKILATDISTKMLETAKEGVYPQESLKVVPGPLRQKYFQVHPGKMGAKDFRISPQIKDRVVFKQLNLSTPPFPMTGPLDAVFCRNVMIYFDMTVRKKLVDEIHRLLKKGGNLCVGSSESLSGLQVPFGYVEPSIYVK